MPKILSICSKDMFLVKKLFSHGFENANKLFFFTPQLNRFKSYDMRGHLVRVNRLECPVILLA